MTIIRHGHVLLKRTPLVRWSEENGDFSSVLVFRDELSSVRGWKLEWRPKPASWWCAEGATLLSSCRITHTASSIKSPLCCVFSRSELHWNCIINRAEMIPSNSESIHWPLRETRNKTMFLQEEYLTTGPITTSSIYSSKWARGRRFTVLLKSALFYWLHSSLSPNIHKIIF